MSPLCRRLVLSAKAKGKQQAVDPGPNGPPDLRELTIRFTEGMPGLVLHIVEQDSVRHVKAKHNVTSTGEESHLPAQSSMITGLHCSVGPVAQIQPLRGFDHLATAGFSDEDNANFRRQFHEQWVNSLDNGGNTQLAQSSSQVVVIRGVVLVFFFPAIPFFFPRASKPEAFWDASKWKQPKVSYSRELPIITVHPDIRTTLT
ncbi:hypothetical protein EDD15DRAFT_2392354 [Pisolithus albus]|nr:hypothetical protein EDD15DRAFT_2392354 [Pisolithus albus]